jgi:aspartyl protease family protein
MRHDFFDEPERGGGVMGWAIRQLALWLVAGLVVYWLVANFGLIRPSGPEAKPQAQLQPQAADVASAERGTLGRPAPIVANSLSLRARADGHVVLDAEVNGVPVRFLVDTGATTVSLTPQDAIRAGVAGSLNYSITVSTANGLSKAAPVTLRDIRIGTLQVDDINAEVMQAQGGISLLGQTFLNRLQSYRMKDGVLTLSWQ